MKTSIYYINKLKQKLSETQEKNPNYSLRAYARDLGIHPASLSLIIKSKRAFPLNSFDRVSEALGLTEDEKILFLESVSKVKFSVKRETTSTLLKVRIKEDKLNEVEDLITNFSKQIQNIGRPAENEPAKNFVIKISRH
jgi:plasmid maintenance system antidote protein VapI